MIVRVLLYFGTDELVVLDERLAIAVLASQCSLSTLQSRAISP